MADIAQLHQSWLALCQTYCSDQELVSRCWKELEAAYSSPDRHYHNLDHIENMVGLAEEYVGFLQSPDTVLFAIFYHDIVYNTKREDNEEQSAELAGIRLMELGISEEMTHDCKTFISATRTHESSDDPDLNYLLDMDLSTLGFEWEKYRLYAAGVRKEYSQYPGFLYRGGRRKVLKHFLKMGRIYKTEVFYTRFEMQARGNLQRELKEL